MDPRWFGDIAVSCARPRRCSRPGEAKERSGGEGEKGENQKVGGTKNKRHLGP